MSPTEANVMSRLREETRAEHRAAERQPFARAMMRRELELQPFGEHLWAYRFLYTALIEALEACEGPEVDAVWHHRLDRRPHLDRDLEHLGVERPASLGRWEMEVEDEVQALAERGGAALLGALYVLEGSALGAQIIVDRLAGSVPEEALHYYRGYAEETRALWAGFCRRMAATIVAPGDQDDCVHGAERGFALVGSMFESIWRSWCDGTVSMTRRVARSLRETA